MATLRSPKGKLYTTDNPREINDLTLGHGYTVEHDGNATERPPDQPPDQPILWQTPESDQ